MLIGFYLSVFFIFCYLSGTTDALLTTLLNLGPQDESCPNWSPYSRCIWVNEVTLTYQLPENCRYNQVFALIQQQVPGGLETFYKIMKQFVGINRVPCGQCSSKLSCARGLCDGYSSIELLNWFNTLGSDVDPPERNIFGVHDKPCDQDSGLACVFEVTRADCLNWPPPSIAGLIGDENVYNLVKALKPIECIVLGGFCYCCCTPYKPDPCTAKCVVEHFWERYKDFPPWEIMQYNCPAGTRTPPPLQPQTPAPIPTIQSEPVVVKAKPKPKPAPGRNVWSLTEALEEAGAASADTASDGDIRIG